ncbi:MAG: MBL fold metallo-hydrolase [Deltaproteobacteria bacterium]|nr:MBL fold metallo-hydrolase [Deltaproteobacteria bacterium]
MGEILKTSEALWTGITDTIKQHPFGRPWGIEKITDNTWFYKSFANMIIHETSDGLVIIDPGMKFDAETKYNAVREVTDQPLRIAVFTHGHLDHISGIPLYVKEAEQNDWPLPKVIAHEALPDRFKRYRATASWKGYIDGRQFFGGGKVETDLDYYFPDITYKDRTDVTLGGSRALLRHARAETDDHTWVYLVEDRILCTGDLFIWAVPNAGNPQKVQRYAEEWAVALREMAALEPKYLLPGHGFPIVGVKRVNRALLDTAAYLESLVEQTLAQMNQGVALDTIVHSVTVPKKLLNKPYLKPIYDEPQFIVRNIWRLVGGWYDGMPSHLKPAPEADQAKEIAKLAGGVTKLLARAKKLAKKGDLRMACHLAEWAVQASPKNKTIRKTAADIFNARAESEISTMAIGIYRSFAKELEGSSHTDPQKGTVIQSQRKRGEKKKPSRKKK